ncbi:uncharacterized protein LOC119611166 [Lucilia sericata]|uniref:uncharacterized protein LOC119611166 n=1 Tax=Lucilia sericata TaxID=13632 RepID=UPI0018A8560B|nr:uncharacterized protein LOC119611166 [Lucilia sericata]
MLISFKKPDKKTNRRLTATRPSEDSSTTTRPREAPNNDDYHSTTTWSGERRSQSSSHHHRGVTSRQSEGHNRQRSRHHTTQHNTRRDPALYQCKLCMRFHAIRFCPKFLNMTVIRRIEVVTRHKYCVNCLAKSHIVRDCTSMASCRRCHRFHHTMLHPPKLRITVGNQTSQQRHQRPKPHRRTLLSTIQRPQQNQPPNTSTAQTPDPQTTQPTTSANINQNIIIEAIKSLAEVLCSTNKGPSVA